MGLDPHAFSKVGDCQSVKAAFMGYFDLGRYSLGNDSLYLQKTIDNFAGHFNTDGQAVRGGSMPPPYFHRSGPIRTPACRAKIPLECELRSTRPIIVIVRMEIWWDDVRLHNTKN